MVNELKVAGVRDVAAANACIRDHYIPAHNEEFARTPKELARIGHD